MAIRMVKVTNMVNSMVSVKDVAYNVNRRWNKRGQTLPIPYEAVEGLLWQDGFRRMIESGILYIADMKDKQDLGLEPLEAKEPVNIIALTEIQMKNLLTSTPLTVFKKEVQALPKVQVDNLIEYAIQNKLTNSEKCSFLKALTKKDILAAISAKEDDERQEARERAKRASYAEEGRR